MKGWIFFSCTFILNLWSCRTWHDKDLFIQEIFINAKNEPYLILKNAGHTDINEPGIDLAIRMDEKDILSINLDSIDPHFRKAGDSSIIPLPFRPGSTIHHILARVDTKNRVQETDEDHNIYARTIRGPMVSPERNTFIYPSIHSSFDPKTYLGLISTGPIAQMAKWDNGSRSLPLQYWPPAWKELLLSQIAKIYSKESIIYPDTLTTDFTYDQAFAIYLSYLAHSLYLEHERLVPWSVNDFDPASLKDLWDAHQYFQWDSIHKVYQYNYESGGAIRVYHPIATYLFAQGIQTQDAFFNEHEAISSVLNWSRANLHHTERTGQIYFQSVPQTWYPGNGNVHAVYSCWATGGMIMEYGRALNLPIQRNTIELYNGIHTQLSFPEEGNHLTHADDLYDPLFYPADHEIPIQSLMMNDKEYNDFIRSQPLCLGDTCHSKGTQHTYDRRKFLVLQAAALKSPYLLSLYDSGSSAYQAYLRGDEFNSLLLPVLNREEQNDVTRQLLENRTDPSTISDLFTRYQNCKNNRR